MPTTTITTQTQLLDWITARNAQTTWTEDEIAEIDASDITLNGGGIVTLNPGGSGFRAIIQPAAGRVISGALRPIYGTRATISLRDFTSLRMGSARAICRGVQLTRGNGDGQQFRVQSNGRFEECIADQGSSNNTLLADDGSGGEFVACLLVGKSGGSWIADANGGLWLRRCTLIANGATSAVRSNFTTLGVVGCAFRGFTTDLNGALLSGSTHNATSNGTSVGTSGQTGLTDADFVSVTAGSEDWAPAAGSTRLVNTGTTISGVTRDILRTSIPQGASPDIGAVEVAAPTGATAITLTGPSSGTVGSPSTNFTVGANGTITGTITVTPNDGGDGGTFTPTSVAISAASPTATFTYTAANPGSPTATINVTNTGSLTNPAGIAYSASLPPATTMTIALKQSDGTTAAASITGIEYAILNAPTLGAATAILDTGTGESTDGSGNLVLDITGLGLTPGQVRYVIAGKSNGTVGADFDGWHGPATAA